LPVRHAALPFCCALLLTALPAAAQVRDTTRTDTTVFRIDELRIRAIRPVTTVGGTSAVEVRLDLLELGPAPLLEEALRALPSLHVRTNSRGEAELTIRGSESRQVAVLLDGVPLTLQWDGRTDVSLIPATAAQELGLVRGLSSMLHGPNTLGGVVELRVGSGSVPARRALHTATGIDHLGGWSTSAAATVPIERDGGSWLLRGGAGYRERPGLPLARNVVEPEPGRAGRRLNTDLQHADGFLAARYRADGGAWVSLSGTAFRAERGIAAELDSPSPRFWRYPHVSRAVAVAAAGTGERGSPFGGRAGLELGAGLDAGRTDIDAYADRTYDEVVGFENARPRTVTLRLRADQSLGARGELAAAVTYADIRNDEIVPAGTLAYRQTLWSAGAETGWRVVEDGGAVRVVRVSAGAAFDAGATPRTGDKPAVPRRTGWGARAGVTAVLRGSDALLHAGISRRGRFPALREAFSGALNRFDPNPDLLPERLTAFEAGVTANIGNGALQTVGFHHRLDDAITRITLPDRRFRRVNQNRLRSTGIDVIASQTLGAVAVGGDVTLQSVAFIEPDRPGRRPENQPAVLGSAHARFPLPAGLHARTEVRWTGAQYCAEPGSTDERRLDAGAHLHADLGRAFRLRGASSWFDRLEVRAAIDNIGDAALYDQCGLPQPGRLLRFQLRLF
jgi:iron complex outermembrane receptor protein